MSKLGNHIEYVKGFAFKSKDYTETGIPVIRVSNFTDNSIDIKDVYHIPKERFSEFQKVNLIKDDIVIATVGSWPTNPSSVVGKTIRVPPEANNTLLNQNAVRIRSLDKDEQLYFYYVLKDKSFSDYIISTAQGSANQASITLKSILDYDLPNIDSKEKRIKIGKTLATYDEKIQLNTQINQTLEQIAQALFKSWFVDFDPVRAKVQALSGGLSLEQAELAAMQTISGKTAEELTALSQTQPDRYAELAETAKAFPCEMVEVDGVEVPKGWNLKALDEIANYQNGLALQKFRPEDDEPFLPVVKIAQLRQGYADGEEKAKASIKPECIIDNGDVIFSWSGSLLVDIWCGGKAALNQHLFKVTSKRYPKWFYYFYTKYHLAEFQRIAYDKAVTMGHIKREHLSAAKCIVPNDELLANKTLENILEKIIFDRLENFNLQDTRDLLLPKLLNGEI